MPADPSAAALPHVPADVLEAFRLVVAEVIAQPKPLLIKKPWAFVGIGKTAWYKLASADKTPKPVKLDGVGVAYRRADLEAFVAKLKTA